jgi:uncharacterized RDD family membrane protein YckC
VQAYPSQTDPTAVGGQRVVACIIDRGLGFVLYVVMFLALSKPIPSIFGNNSYNYCSGQSMCQNFGSRYVSGGSAGAIILVQLAYLIGVFILQRGITGRTLGMNAFGLVTVNEQGQPIGPGMALVRSFAGIVDYIPCCFPLVGTITIFTTTGHRRVGDMAAKSFVVPRSYAGQPIFVPGITGPAYGTSPYAQPYGQQPYGQPYGQQPYVAPTTQPYAPPTSQPGQPDQPGQGGFPGAAADAPPPPTATPPPAPVDPTQPQWDPARNAYIQWDPAGQRWMQFDQATQQWRGIS